MKKRLLSLALCLAMLLPTLLLFTSCQEEEVEVTGTIAPMTIVIALMTDEKTNDAGIEVTEKALNRITENNFNTHVELKLFTEDEYYAKVEEALLARRKAINDGDKSTSVGDVKDKIYDEMLDLAFENAEKNNPSLVVTREMLIFTEEEKAGNGITGRANTFNHVRGSMGQWMSGQLDVYDDKVWADWCDLILNELGGNDYLEICQAAYDRYLANVG